MEVSHFELIYKPQSPVGPGGTGTVDTVLQGYFLEITNLETKELKFQVEFVALPPAAGQPLRSLAGNTLVFIDTPGVNNGPTTLAGGFASTSFFPASGLITVAPNATALVAVVPSVFGASPLDPTPIAVTDKNFEVRGFVRLNLPALRTSRFFKTAQAMAPVKVLLTPQNRTTYYAANGTLSDQTQSSLPTASGAAITLVPPELSQFTFPDIVIKADTIQPIPIEAQPATLISLLADLDADPSSLRALNKALEEAEIPVAIERKVRKPARAASASELAPTA